MTEQDHREFIIDTLNEWYIKHSSDMNVINEKLIENESFKLSIVSNDLTEEAYFLCSCKIKIYLTKTRDTFSLSNYYKHLKSKSCNMMKKRKINDSHANDESFVTLDAESLDDEPSQRSVLDQTQSSISCHSTSYIDRLLKRSTLSDDILPKRRRIQK